MTDFFLKKSTFSAFSDIFENHHFITQKSFACDLCHVNKFDQTHYSLISRFSNDNVFKTGVHFRF